jgi:hypothetical protein
MCACGKEKCSSNRVFQLHNSNILKTPSQFGSVCIRKNSILSIQEKKKIEDEDKKRTKKTNKINKTISNMVSLLDINRLSKLYFAFKKIFKYNLKSRFNYPMIKSKIETKHISLPYNHYEMKFVCEPICIIRNPRFNIKYISINNTGNLFTTLLKILQMKKFMKYDINKKLWYCYEIDFPVEFKKYEYKLVFYEKNLAFNNLYKKYNCKWNKQKECYFSQIEIPELSTLVI